MSEIVYLKSKPPPKYLDQPVPHIRNREEGETHRLRERRNKAFHKQLESVKKEPPSVFHAPKGYQSLKDGSKMQKEREGREKNDMPGTRAYVEVSAWPPTSADHNAVLRGRQQRELDTENNRIKKKLEELYQSKRMTMYGQHKEMGTAINCNERWAQRTSLYAPAGNLGSSQQQAAADPGASQQRPRPSSAPRALQVPKTLGVASCAGCGTKAFRSADGPGLSPCAQCKQVFYCSETCAKTDFQSHKALCKFHTTGVWPPYGQRPEADYWVNNAAMAKARRELKSRQNANQRLAPEEELEEQERLEEIVRRERTAELGRKEKQAHIEWRASWGLDGPRPCMYMDGKKI